MRAIWPRARWPRIPRAFGGTSTRAPYTAIAACGEPTAETPAKDARKRQWEQALAHLREAAGDEAPRERGQHADHVGNPYNELPGGLDWDTVQRVAGMDLIDDHVLRQKEADSHDAATAAWQDLRYDSRAPGAPPLAWPANTGPDLVRHNLPPQSLWAPDSMRMTAMRRRHTSKKMALQELSTGHMIHSLLGQANIARFSRALLGSDAAVSRHLLDIACMDEAQAQQARKDILQHLDVIHSTHVKSSGEEIAKLRMLVHQPAIPSYIQDPDGDFHAICKRMNLSIAHLLEQVPRGNDRAEALAVAKICHNLLVSTAPPDLQTFNILLVGFKRMGRPNMVDCCIKALYTQKIRPNELTCREIMGHYVHERRPDDFSRFVARMRGVGDALVLANPSITINEASHDRLVRISETKVYQKVHPTPMVFGSLIGGALKFAGFDRALDIYYEMKTSGWGLHVQGLTRLLRDCVHRGDWEGGLYVWEEISNIKNNASVKDITSAYSHMLSLCSITGNTVAFNQVLTEVAQRGLDRKTIIAAATKQTRQMQKKTEYLAPAWAADNVLIAVSDYLDDVKAGVDEDNSFEDVALDDQKSPEDLWASWVEAEFGEKPKDPEL
ncbi:hypothetical protein T440DRAFT_494799 [Plenodomus tracheiphilus IPT5]|uniref:Uncharacterized protein n=1 Tax=Plenodomus tracheiphilus IPT5 TaxID=1408161 RepID=A0A6A7BKG7_9PLEO|nr:hypothetical protein T440DRAFT_494799 [Plenodomus tracheiphilus IPT5]